MITDIENNNNNNKTKQNEHNEDKLYLLRINRQE